MGELVETFADSKGASYKYDLPRSCIKQKGSVILRFKLDLFLIHAISKLDLTATKMKLK